MCEGFLDFEGYVDFDTCLNLQNGCEDFEVHTDASGVGLGYLLMQKRKVLGYASRQLKNHKKKYPTHDLDLIGVVFTLKTWRHYLYEVTFKFYTDHNNLKYIFTQNDLNNRQRR